MSEVIAPEAAGLEFERLSRMWDLDDDVASMDDEDRKSFESIKRRVIRAIENGRLRVNDDATAAYTLLEPIGETLTEVSFRMPDGRAVLAWDKYKEREAIHKLNAYLGAMTGQNPAIFARMSGIDLKVSQALAQLFLGS